MVDLGEGFELEHLGDLDAAKLADPAKIVAEKIGDHHQLGNLQRIFVKGSLRAQEVVPVRIAVSIDVEIARKIHRAGHGHADVADPADLDLLVLRSELDNQSAKGNSTAEFDAFRAQTTRNLNTLQTQIQTLQQQITARP